MTALAQNITLGKAGGKNGQNSLGGYRYDQMQIKEPLQLRMVIRTVPRDRQGVGGLIGVGEL